MYAVVKKSIDLGLFWHLDRSTMHPDFDLAGVRTHDLQIITVHYMSLRRPSSPLSHQGYGTTLLLDNIYLSNCMYKSHWWLSGLSRRLSDMKYSHDLGVMSSNPGRVELGMHGTSALSRTWTTKHFMSLRHPSLPLSYQGHGITLLLCNIFAQMYVYIIKGKLVLTSWKQISRTYSEEWGKFSSIWNRHVNKCWRANFCLLCENKILKLSTELSHKEASKQKDCNIFWWVRCSLYQALL